MNISEFFSHIEDKHEFYPDIPEEDILFPHERCEKVINDSNNPNKIIKVIKAIMMELIK